MKLVDFLIAELKEWPVRAEFIADNRLSIAAFGADRYCEALDLPTGKLMKRGGMVTKCEWQAAVDALNAPKVVEWEQGDIPPIGEACEAYVLADTEKQGRPMNRWISGKFIGKALSDNGGIILMVECEDGWAHAINAFSYVRPIRTAEQVAAEERERAWVEHAEKFRLSAGGASALEAKIRGEVSMASFFSGYDAALNRNTKPCGS